MFYKRYNGYYVHVVSMVIAVGRYTTNFLEFGSHENQICNISVTNYCPNLICDICNFHVDHAILAGSYKTHTFGFM